MEGKSGRRGAECDESRMLDRGILSVVLLGKSREKRILRSLHWAETEQRREADSSLTTPEPTPKCDSRFLGPLKRSGPLSLRMTSGLVYSE